MVKILLLAAVIPSEMAISRAIAEWTSADYEVELVSLPALGPLNVVPAMLPCYALDTRRPLRKGGLAMDPVSKSWRLASRMVDRYVWPVIGRRILARVDLSRRMWFYAYHDVTLRAKARRADIIIALDRNALYTAWKIGRKTNRTAYICFGVEAGVQYIRKFVPQPTLVAGNERSTTRVG
jgi:hypothetical protein